MTPPSIAENWIGFQTVDGNPLTGCMHVDLTNVFVKLPKGTMRQLTGANPLVVGGVTTNGDDIHIKYNF